jgi:hypothetical protein
LSTAAAFLSSSLDDVPQYRPYSEANRPDGRVGLKFYDDFLRSYSTTRTRPHFVLTWQVNALANMLRDDTFASSNPKAVIDHPAFQMIRWLGASALPLLIQRLEREPSLWLTALPSLVGTSPVRPESRGRVLAMISDWREWAQQNGFTGAH